MFNSFSFVKAPAAPSIVKKQQESCQHRWSRTMTMTGSNTITVTELQKNIRQITQNMFKCVS